MSGILVQNIECQLAQVQLKRFLEGEDLPQELQSDLEQHLRSCRQCMAVAQGQRAALEDQLATSKPHPIFAIGGLFKAAVSPRPAAHETALDPAQAILSQPGVDGSATSPLAVLRQPKNLLLLGGLVIVMGLMTTVMKNPTHVFGPKAIEKSEVAVEAKPESNASDTAVASIQESTTPPSLVGVTPVTLKPAPPAPGLDIALKALHGGASPPRTASVSPVPEPSRPTPPAPTGTSQKSQDLAKHVPGERTMDREPIISVGGDEAPVKISRPKAVSPHHPARRVGHHVGKRRQRGAKTPHKIGHRPTARHRSKPVASKRGGVTIYDPSGKPLLH